MTTQPRGSYVRGRMFAGRFVPDPDLLSEIPTGSWELVGSAVDLALAQGSTAGFPSQASAAKIRESSTGREVFVTADAWRTIEPEYRP